MLVIFHVPLFTSWLKQVTSGGTRVLMIIDAPDDLEQLMSPPGLKQASTAECLPQYETGARDDRRRHRLLYECASTRS